MVVTDLHVLSDSDVIIIIYFCAGTAVVGWGAVGCLCVLKRRRLVWVGFVNGGRGRVVRTTCSARVKNARLARSFVVVNIVGEGWTLERGVVGERVIESKQAEWYAFRVNHHLRAFFLILSSPAIVLQSLE